MIRTIIHSADWQYNETSDRLKKACNYAANQYFEKLDQYSLEYDYNEMLQIIPGDLFDRKNKSSIEEFIWIKNFLDKCCTYSETIITIGNHDYDTRDKDRKKPSLLKLLTENFDIPGLTYYENSGIYEYNDQFRFFVFSNIEKNKRPENFESNLKNDKINIGLYHDILSNAKDFNPMYDYSKHGKYPSVEIFNGLNAVIMGDIHKRQAIPLSTGGYAIYAGSPYQRTWGEDVNNHGIVKWNIPELSYEFVDLDNPYKLIKLQLDIETKKINILN